MTLVKHHNHPFKHRNGFLNNFFSDDFFRPLQQENQSMVPAVNISETKDAFQIELAAPGLKKDEFKINLEKDMLTIMVSREETVEQEDENYRVREFNFSNFERSFRLPRTVNKDGIKASYEDGVLHMSLPKLEEAIEKGPREISIS